MRLSPLSIPYRGVESITRLVWVIVVVSLGGSQAMPDFGVPAVVVVAGGMLALAVGYQVLYYQRYEYELTEDTFDIRSGVLSRRHREIPYARVQNVDLSRNVVQRALGIAEVKLETAGGSDTEADLRFVTETEARHLQDEVGRRKRAAAGVTAAEEAATEPEEEPLFAVTTRELALLGAVSLDLRLVPVLWLVLPFVAPQLARQLDPGTVAAQPTPFAFLAAPVVAFGLYLAAAAVSGAIAVTNYWGFELWRSRDELRYERGLFQRFSGTIPLEKVQTLTVSGNVLARTIGYRSLTVETAGYAPGDNAGSQSAIPFAERDRVYDLANEVAGFDSPEWSRPPKRARQRYAVRWTIVATVAVAVVYAVARFGPWSFPWYYALALFALVPPAAHLQWANRGYAIQADHVLTRNGFWTRSVKVVPYHRVQTVATRQTVFQRRRDLATLVVDTAGRSGLTGSDPMAVDIDAEEAEALRSEIQTRFRRSLADHREARQRRRRQSLASVESVGSGPGETGGATPS